MEGPLVIVGFVLAGVWGLALLVTSIWFLIDLFRASWGWALAGLFLPFVHLVMVFIHWDKVKRSFLTQLGVTVVGIAGVFGFIGLMGAMTANSPPSSAAANPDPDPGAQPRGEIIELQIPVSTAWGTTVQLGGRATIIVPHGWRFPERDLPHLAWAAGDEHRGEHLTVHLLPRDGTQLFDELQQAALSDVRQHIIKSGEPTLSGKAPFPSGQGVSYGMSGRGLLPDQKAKPMSCRVTCIEGQHNYFYVVQWRTAAWDQDSIQTFDRILRSLKEL